MDKEEVLEIITMIADGIDPFGVKVPSKDPPEDNSATITTILFCSLVSALRLFQVPGKISDGKRIF